MFVTFLSDFGLQDDFVGTCHGVVLRIAPEARIIDITHGIPPQAVLQGALVLASTLPYMPVGVHLAVVDPGVGGHRRALVVRDAEGRLYVGPDNGLLLPAADRAGIVEAHELANPAYALESISRTFHGRDLFAPAAAHLARGVPIGELGPPIDPDALVRLELPVPAFEDGFVQATTLYLDSFGNIALNLTRDDLERSRHRAGNRASSWSSPGSGTSRSPRERSRMPARATSSSTRTATATCRSRSRTAMRRRCCAPSSVGRSRSGSSEPRLGRARAFGGAADPSRVAHRNPIR